MLRSARCFNLNLLECKSKAPPLHSSFTLVLISTYWNVNPKNESKEQLNRKVLISTYWNVNFSSRAESSISKPVLISTYWNVNFSKYPSGSSGGGF